MLQTLDYTVSPKDVADGLYARGIPTHFMRTGRHLMTKSCHIRIGNYYYHSDYRKAYSCGKKKPLSAKDATEWNQYIDDLRRICKD